MRSLSQYSFPRIFSHAINLGVDHKNCVNLSAGDPGFMFKTTSEPFLVDCGANFDTKEQLGGPWLDVPDLDAVTWAVCPGLAIASSRPRRAHEYIASAEGFIAALADWAPS